MSSDTNFISIRRTFNERTNSNSKAICRWLNARGRDVARKGLGGRAEGTAKWQREWLSQKLKGDNTALRIVLIFIYFMFEPKRSRNPKWNATALFSQGRGTQGGGTDIGVHSPRPRTAPIAKLVWEKLKARRGVAWRGVDLPLACSPRGDFNRILIARKWI